MITFQRETHSAVVKLYLHAGDARLELGHLGPGFGILASACEIPTKDCELETVVDGKVTRWPIRITSDVTAGERRFSFERQR